MMNNSDLKVGRVLDAAEIGIVEQVWFTAAVDAFGFEGWTEGRMPHSVETIRLVDWTIAESALEKWFEETDDPNYLDVISKTRAAAESLMKGE